uniref:Uncharacterized protein n=1 Tax=Arundo donax TaxID=35708 RepID=A0A0A9GPT4_ARUDO
MILSRPSYGSGTIHGGVVILLSIVNLSMVPNNFTPLFFH